VQFAEEYILAGVLMKQHLSARDTGGMLSLFENRSSGPSKTPTLRLFLVLRLIARDRAVDGWLRETVAPAYDALKADPSRAVSAAHVRSALSTAHKKALAKKV
jgi:hypothetical protein